MCAILKHYEGYIDVYKRQVHTYRDLGDYYLNQSGMVHMPEEWKGSIDLTTFGRNAAAQEKGAFTEYGYICLLYTSRCV